MKYVNIYTYVVSSSTKIYTTNTPQMLNIHLVPDGFKHKEEMYVRLFLEPNIKPDRLFKAFKYTRQ